MENEKKPKWDIGAAVNAGKETCSLLTTYNVDLTPRLQANEQEQLEANTTELEARRSGQSENLNTQKSSTKGKKEAIAELHQMVISVRDVVKSSDAPKEILQAYGVGGKINNSFTSAVAAGNMILKAYKDNTAVNKKMGLLEEDIAEINRLITVLTKADGDKSNSVFAKKAKTMDKNILHRAVEDEVTHISAIGALVFRKKNPAVAALFESLIPGSPKAKTKPPVTTSKTD